MYLEKKKAEDAAEVMVQAQERAARKAAQAQENAAEIAAKAQQELSDKEHFRPFIEARAGRPLKISEIVYNKRAETWGTQEEINAELSAKEKALKEYPGTPFDYTPFDDYYAGKTKTLPTPKAAAAPKGPPPLPKTPPPLPKTPPPLPTASAPETPPAAASKGPPPTASGVKTPPPLPTVAAPKTPPPLPAASAPETPPAAALCQSCKEPLSVGAKFCHACGASVQALCPHCGAQAIPGARFCPQCGKAVTVPAP